LAVDSYIPELAVKGDIEEPALTSLSADQAIELDDAYLESEDEGPRVYGVSVRLVGDGDVDWFVSGPTSWDLEEFTGSVEGETTGGGFITEVETSTVEVFVSSLYCPSEKSWGAISFETVRQVDDERRRRASDHAERQFAREQELGLKPSNEEIARTTEAPPLAH